jgi:hypothetical protein
MQRRSFTRPQKFSVGAPLEERSLPEIKESLTHPLVSFHGVIPLELHERAYLRRRAIYKPGSSDDKSRSVEGSGTSCVEGVKANDRINASGSGAVTEATVPMLILMVY